MEWNGCRKDSQTCEMIEAFIFVKMSGFGQLETFERASLPAEVINDLDPITCDPFALMKAMTQ
jgi:hypothetical protein